MNPPPSFALDDLSHATLEQADECYALLRAIKASEQDRSR